MDFMCVWCGLLLASYFWAAMITLFADAIKCQADFGRAFGLGFFCAVVGALGATLVLYILGFI